MFGTFPNRVFLLHGLRVRNCQCRTEDISRVLEAKDLSGPRKGLYASVSGQQERLLCRDFA